MRKGQDELADLPSVSVVTASFDMERWDSLREALRSVLAQTVQGRVA